jgi:hypothetical protein
MQDFALPNVGASIKKNKKIQQYNTVQGSIQGRRATAGRHLDSVILPIFFGFFFTCPPLFVEVVNSCWLAPAHARPGQTLPKKFKHP